MFRRAQSHAIHESFSREAEVRASSDRGFGLVFAAVFGLVGLVPLWRGRPPRWWATAVALALLGLAVLAPRLLGPLNRIWLRIGLALHAVVQPVVMGLLFFGTVTPLALLMRALGKDPLRLRLEPGAPTYWIERRPPGPKPDTMPRQF